MIGFALKATCSANQDKVGVTLTVGILHLEVRSLHDAPRLIPFANPSTGRSFGRAVEVMGASYFNRVGEYYRRWTDNGFHS